jgi:hypothetical protein
MDHHNFVKYYIIFYAQLTSPLHGKGFLATPQEIDKYLSIKLAAVQIWTSGDLYFAQEI